MHFVRLERNARIFQSASMPLILLWDRMRFLASLWSSANGCFKENSATDLHRDWATSAHCY